MILGVLLIGCVLGFQDGITWTDGKALHVEGQAWEATDSPWDRLPARAEGIVRKPVWSLSRQSAGIIIKFRTDASEIHVKWDLILDRLALPHMPATGASGLDLYVHDGQQWRWASTPRPTAQSNQARLVHDLDPIMRDWMLYLPLYNGVESISIGVPVGSLIEPMSRRPDETLPVVFYGTSITQGGCASRPGMTHVAIVGRELDREVINLGFSGNGTMDIEMADFIAEIDAVLYVIDCLPNLESDDVLPRTVPFIKRLRSLRPDTPILLVEDRSYSDAHVNRKRAERNRDSRLALQEAAEVLATDGCREIYYLEGDRLLDANGESTVDGSHPTDLGFRQQADAFKKSIKPILNQ